MIETKERIEPVAGNNAYLSIDAELTKVTYDLLEMEIAGIVYDAIKNVKNYDASSVQKASDLIIPIDDVYYALISNNILDIEHFAADDASETEQGVFGAFLSKQAGVLASIQSELTSETSIPFGDLDNENKDYITYIIDTEDTVYLQWADGSISLKDYLNHAIAENWIDITRFSVDEKYSDSDEIYAALLQFMQEELTSDTDFAKIVYKYMIHQNLIGGTQLCLLLYDQGVLKRDEAQIAALTSGSVSAYNFIREKIKNLEITPAQLALDPCTGSCVITDVKTGELLALVSYPGYDNNRLANTMDSKYWTSLREDRSNPLYNYATQERTAPGSTFKMVSATAGFSEGVINTEEKILDEGRFTRLEEKGPTCWIHPSSHGQINVSEAIRDSCNYYFYETGYRLSLNGTVYNEKKGIKSIQEYAAMYGLNDTVGIEIPESAPQVADEYPITAAIGQSNNNYTTAQIARYVTAVANKGTVYQETLLKEVRDCDNKNVLESYAPQVKNQIDVLDSKQWDAIHSGMRMMAEDSSSFKDFPIAVAGKTGTAQQVTNRPNHALFISYAPYESPEISVTVRVANGYTSDYAAQIAKDVIKYYYDLADEDEIAGKAEALTGGSLNAD